MAVNIICWIKENRNLYTRLCCNIIWNSISKFASFNFTLNWIFSYSYEGCFKITKTEHLTYVYKSKSEIIRSWFLMLSPYMDIIYMTFYQRIEELVDWIFFIRLILLYVWNHFRNKRVHCKECSLDVKEILYKLNIVVLQDKFLFW